MAYEGGLASADTLELLARAPDPVRAVNLTARQITAALKRARRHNAAAKAETIKDALSQQQLAQPAAVTAAYAATVQATAAVLITLNEQIDRLETQVVAHFHQHPDAEIYLSQPGIGNVNGPRLLAEFGDDPGRFASPKPARTTPAEPDHPRVRAQPDRPGPVRPQRPARRCPAHPGPVRTVRIARRPRLLRQATRPRASHNSALRQLSNRLVGILHGCLKTGTCYHETTAWRQHAAQPNRSQLDS